MHQERIVLAHKESTGYEIPLGPVNLVFIVTDIGMIGCGAFDILALDRFDYPAARARTTEGSPIVTIQDLMESVIRDANRHAEARGILEGMPVREALARI